MTETWLRFYDDRITSLILLVEPGGVRTADLLNAIQALSQLSYGPFLPSPR